MRRLFAALILCLMLTTQGARAAEDPFFAWIIELGGDGLTSPAAMATSMHGGIFIVGDTDSEDGVLGKSLGGTDGFILRVAENGAILWEKRLGGSMDDAFTTVVEMPDGGCLALGTTLSADGDARSSRGGSDAWLVRLDAQGEVLFSKCLGGSLDDELTVLQVTEEGMIFTCGRTQSRNGDLGANYGGFDAWATLLGSEDGKPLWTYRYGFTGDDMFTAAYPIHEGWLLLGEVAEEIPQGDGDEPLYSSRPIAQMLSIEGDPSWENPIMLGDTGDSRLFAITETDTGWLLAGETNSRSALMPSPHGSMDIWVLHMRQTGTVAWQRVFGSTKDEHLLSIQAMPSGGYILLGKTNARHGMDGQVYGAHGAGDVWIARLTPSGMLDWQQPIGGSGESSPVGFLFKEDGGYLAAGTTTSQDGDIGRHLSVRTGFLAELSRNGNLLGTRAVTQSEECSLVQVTAAGGVAYILGNVRTVSTDGPIEILWAGRLAEEGFASE